MNPIRRADQRGIVTEAFAGLDLWRLFSKKIKISLLLLKPIERLIVKVAAERKPPTSVIRVVNDARHQPFTPTLRDVDDRWI
jgi:hypothetical protein